MKKMRTTRRIPRFVENEIVAVPGPMRSIGGMGIRGRMHRRGKCRELAFGIENFGPECGRGFDGISNLESEEFRHYQILDLEEEITWHKFRLAEINLALDSLDAMQEDEDVSKTQLERVRAYLEMRKRNHEAKIKYFKKLKELATNELENQEQE